MHHVCALCIYLILLFLLLYDVIMYSHSHISNNNDNNTYNIVMKRTRVGHVVHAVIAAFVLVQSE